MPLKPVSIIAIAGPRPAIDQMAEELRMLYDQVVLFGISDNFGEFPDTSGYTRDDYEKIELREEDPQLLKVMKNCLDSVDYYCDKKMKFMAKMNFSDVRYDLHGNTLGGKIFALAGFVHHGPMMQNVGKRIIVAHA